MPVPQYVICCQNVTEDSRTGLIDHYHIIETLRPVNTVVANQHNVCPIQSFVVTAVWRRLPNDPIEQEYESVTVMTTSDGEERGSEPQRFSFHAASWMIRLILFVSPIPSMGAGQFVIKSKIRPVGGNEWMTQEYVIFIEPEQAANEASPSVG
jgi:hypothetical protein